MNMELEKAFVEVLGREKIKKGEPMSRHTTFRIGGEADWFLTPSSIEEMKQILVLCNREKLPYYIMGNGSNLLVADRGYRGAVIQIYKEMNQIVVEGNVIRAQAGALLSKIASVALEQQLTGFESIAGIPGTLGGAVVMNAGAYDGEMKDVLSEVTVMDQEGKCFTIPKDKLELEYRSSIIAKKGYIVLEAKITLLPGKAKEISGRMEELKEKRTTKQPLEFPSAGSTFKRPKGHFAGQLIDEAGLRGFQVGGAQISEKHCGFVINKNQATAADVVELMRQVSKIVKEKTGVTMEPEVKRIGEF